MLKNFFFFENINKENTLFFDNSLFISFFGFDHISAIFIIFTLFIFFLCFIYQTSNIFSFFNFLQISNLFFMEFFVISLFLTFNLFTLYFLFEATLFSMFIYIGVYGSRARKVLAYFLLLIYTLVTALLALLSILFINNFVGSLDLFVCCNSVFTVNQQYLLFLPFFFAFAAKIPIFPLHIWLPEAHVEAPTVGSVILAGILLKIGVYGLLRVNLGFFPEASIYFAPCIFAFCSIGVIYGSLAAIRQIDLKRIVAYSSVAHMNLIVIGIFSFNFIAIEGVLLQSISHGFVASALFFLIGILYSRYHTRSIFYFSGLVHVMPLFSFYFLFFTMSNIALPGTSSFVGELLILLGCFMTNSFIIFIVVCSVVLGGSYSLWLANRILFGNIKYYYSYKFFDLTVKEFFILFNLAFFVFLFGIFPFFFLQYIHKSVIFYILCFLI
jgi:proton-translocating NADH-quinone oxidoreductase chain M